MEHYLTKIEIKKLRHLSNINIELNNEKRQHLLFTGKNGSGKTTVLLAMQKYLKAINDRKLNLLKGDYLEWLNNSEKALQNVKEEEKYQKQKQYEQRLSSIIKYSDGLELHFNKYSDLDALYEKGNFIIAYFSADRKTQIIPAQGVQDIKLKDFYNVEEDAGTILVKYMVHLKTQQAYARNESDMPNVVRIEKWFTRFENALRILFDDETLQLKYNYKEYDFSIIEKGREPFSFNELSDGYSSVIHIVSDLILRMELKKISEQIVGELKDKFEEIEMQRKNYG